MSTLTTGSSWGRPLDYGPVLLRKPFGPHLAMGALSSAVPSWGLQVHLGCVRLSPACPCRCLHTCHLRPARHYPRLWIRPPSSGDRRDLNPPDQCAAWRTLCVFPRSLFTVQILNRRPRPCCSSSRSHLPATIPRIRCDSNPRLCSPLSAARTTALRPPGPAAREARTTRSGRSRGAAVTCRHAPRAPPRRELAAPLPLA